MKQQSKNQKLITLLTKHIINKIAPEKNIFFKNFIKLATNSEKQKDLFKLLRKYVITKKLFNQIQEPSRLLNIIYLIKLSLVNQEIADKRWLRALLRKWRFLSFSHNISKKRCQYYTKISTLII